MPIRTLLVTTTLAATVTSILAASPSVTAAPPPGTIAASIEHSIDLALSAGRVTVVVADATERPFEFSRTVTLRSGKVVLGNPTGSGTDVSDVAASGTRTAWVDASEHLNVGTYNSGQRIDNHVDRILSLSGTRLLYVRVNTDGNERVLLADLATGRTVDVSRTFGISAGLGATLDGDTLAYGRSNGAILVRNLATHRVQVVQGAGEAVSSQQLYVSGDWLAWASNTRTSGTVSGYRRLGSTAAPVVVRGGWVTSTGPTGAVAVYPAANDGPPTYRFLPWSGSPVLLPGGSGNGARVSSYVAGVYGSTIAWVDTDGRAKLTPLSRHYPMRPRALGKAIAPSTLARGAIWSFDLPTTAPLASAEIAIKNARGEIVRILSGGVRSAALGEVVASWDGRDGHGRPVPASTYRWTVFAKNADGSLLRPDGTTTRMTGLVRVG